MPKRFFLETSTIRSRLIGHSSIRSSLTEKLRNQTKLTSEFVRMEFNRSLICNLIEFYFNLETQTSIDDAIKWWNETFKPRQLKDLNYSVDKLFIGINDSTNVKLALINLRNEIKKIITLFECLINRFIQNEMQCYFAKVKLDFQSCKGKNDIEKKLVDFYKTFKGKHVDKCRINDYFENSKGKITKIFTCDSKNDTFNKQKKRLNEINDGKSKLSCNTCSIIGDTIITLECPDYAILLSVDEVFKELCDNIGLKYEIIPSLRKILPTKKVLHKLN